MIIYIVTLISILHIKGNKLSVLCPAMSLSSKLKRDLVFSTSAIAWFFHFYYYKSFFRSFFYKIWLGCEYYCNSGNRYLKQFILLDKTKRGAPTPLLDIQFVVFLLITRSRVRIPPPEPTFSVYSEFFLFSQYKVATEIAT